MLKIDLSGVWKLRNKSGNLVVPATVPGDTHSALLAAGKIPDPYWGDNELRLQGLGKEDWIYEREVEVTEQLLAEKSIFLHCESLDTIATIFINGLEVAQTRNAFVRYRFEVKKYLHVGCNELRIEIASPEKAALAENGKQPYAAPHSHYPVEAQHRNLLRKTQCHSGWDWGPCLLVSGIYGEIYLGATSAGRIEYVYTDQKHSAGAVDVTVTCEVDFAKSGVTEFQVEFAGQTETCTAKVVRGYNVLHQTIRVTNPKLWWPNGFGAQPLYDLTVRVGGDVAHRRIGLRTLELQNREDEHGLSMVFVVNGVPIFAKGANWIPVDALPQRQTVAVMDDLLTSAAQSHMNMIRVWGGGQYESDAFYDLCDEKGLLIWQDFMFSCAMYPATKDFLNLVREEVRHQVKRLRHHASLALWCGNNENVGAMGWFEETKTNRDRYMIDYDRLNEGVIGNEVRELDPTRVFWPSSPCGGPGDYSFNMESSNRGDMHYWTIWGSGKPFEEYYKIKPRFCSEFGYQSFPSIDSIRTYAPEDQWNLTAPIMEYHQRHPMGNARIIGHFAEYFRMPEGFENSIYLSQVLQGLSIKMAVEHWRRQRPVCMGTLYWQLNDIWPVCSWASIEHGGKWKLLQYMSKRFYAPLLISAFPVGDKEVEIWVNNDALVAVDGVARVRVIDFQGTVLRTIKLESSIPGGSAVCLRKLSVAELTTNPAGTFLSLEFNTGKELVRNEHLFRKYKECPLAVAKIAVQVGAVGDGFSVSLQTDAPAFFVSLNADGIRGEFDDNCFTLLPGAERRLVFQPKEKVSLEKFRERLSLNHLSASSRNPEALSFEFEASLSGAVEDVVVEREHAPSS